MKKNFFSERCASVRTWNQTMTDGKNKRDETRLLLGLTARQKRKIFKSIEGFPHIDTNICFEKKSCCTMCSYRIKLYNYSSNARECWCSRSWAALKHWSSLVWVLRCLHSSFMNIRIDYLRNSSRSLERVESLLVTEATQWESSRIIDYV